MSALTARVAVGLVSVVVLAWLGVMERDTRLQARAVAAGGHVTSPGAVARADSDLRRARFLNPDLTPDLVRAQIYQGAGQLARAKRMLLSVLRREPDNITAWGALLIMSSRRDPATARLAAAAVRRLDPLDARVARRLGR